jgi:nucleotide-binding universal stress UspA family protein
MSRIIVGVDGSPTAQAALQFAASEAQLRGWPVAIVAAWSNPPMAAMPPTMGSSSMQLEAIEGAAKAIASEALGELRSFAPGVEATASTAMGEPADVLVAAAKADDLLVLGSRGHSEVVSLLLGSTTHACLHRAPCPVVVVPHRTS